MSVKVKLFPFLIAALIFFGGALAAAAAPPASPPPSPPRQQGDVGRGAYLFGLAGGCGCHMGQAGFLAGGNKFEGPFGVVYSANITSDPKTGIGSWTDQKIIEAIRLGKHPDGSQLSSVMPYPALSGMSDQDVQDLVAFLRTAPAIENEVPANQLNAPAPPFQPRTPPPATAPTGGLERGQYIVNVASHCSDCHTPPNVNVASHCSDCHTPRNPDGSLDMSKYLAGGMIEGQIAANITPDSETGIGKWTEQQLVDFLHTGQRPDGSPLSATSLMNLVLQGGLKNITDADAQAVAAYLKSVPAVKNEPAANTPPPAMPESGGDISANQYSSVGLALLGVVSLLAGLLVYRRQYHA